MRKVTLTVVVATLALATTALTANAQSLKLGTGGFDALAQNATPIVKETACRGWGPFCPPGFVRTCNPWRCWCRPCR